MKKIIPKLVVNGCVGNDVTVVSVVDKGFYTRLCLRAKRTPKCRTQKKKEHHTKLDLCMCSVDVVPQLSIIHCESQKAKKNSMAKFKNLKKGHKMTVN